MIRDNGTVAYTMEGLRGYKVPACQIRQVARRYCQYVLNSDEFGSEFKAWASSMFPDVDTLQDCEGSYYRLLRRNHPCETTTRHVLAVLYRWLQRRERLKT